MMRRATPGSEAAASSEDERPWPTAATFGSLPRKENGIPSLKGGIWSSSQPRGSFKPGKQARRNAAREARMGSPGNASTRPANTPSPVLEATEQGNGLPKQDPIPTSEMRDFLAAEKSNVSRLLISPQQQRELLEAANQLLQWNVEEQPTPILETDPDSIAAENPRPRVPRRSVSYASSCSSAASAASRDSRCSTRSRRPRSRHVRKRGKATVHIPSRSPSLSPVKGRNGLLSPLDDRRSSNTTNRLDNFLNFAIRERSPSNGADVRKKQKHPATFECTLCPKRFTRAYNLRSHLRTHTDERPFVCRVCGEAFARQHDRRHHEHLHSEEIQNSATLPPLDARDLPSAREKASPKLMPESGTHSDIETSETLIRNHEDAPAWSCGMMSDQVATCSRSTLVDDRHVIADACGYCGVLFAAPSDWDVRRQHFDDAHKHKQCNQAKRFSRRDHFRLHLKHSHAATQGEWTKELEAKCSGQLVAARETGRHLPKGGSSVQSDIIQAAVEADASAPVDHHEPLQPTTAGPRKERPALRLPAPIYDQGSRYRRPRTHDEDARQNKPGAILQRWTQLYRDVVKWCRPTLRSNHARLEWRCHCAQQFWGDFEYGESEQIQIFARQIEQHGYTITGFTISSGTTTTVSRAQQPDKETIPVSRTSTSSTQQTNVLSTTSSTAHNTAPTTATSYASNASFFATRKPVYLELCIDRSSRITQLGEIVLVNGGGQQIIANDLDLFVSIRKKYNELKRKGLFALLYRPTDIHYVQFGIQLSAQQTDIYQKPDSLPPRIEVDENRYHYYECPLAPLPPMPTRTFYQYFRGHTPNCASRSTLFSDRLPKKLGTNMTSLASADKLEFGWGIHIVEGPNKPLLAALVAAILFLSFLTSVVYDICTKNADSGFAIGQWMVGMLSAVLAAVYFHLQEQ